MTFLFHLRRNTDSPNQTLMHTLYNLASYPEYAEPLREEVAECLGLDTTLWTKKAIEKCCKLDSFLKECQRMNPLAASAFLVANNLHPVLLTDASPSLFVA